MSAIATPEELAAALVRVMVHYAQHPAAEEERDQLASRVARSSVDDAVVEVCKRIYRNPREPAARRVRAMEIADYVLSESLES